MLGYDDPKVYAYIPSEQESDEIYEHARRILAQEAVLRPRIQQASLKCANEVNQLVSLFEASP